MKLTRLIVALVLGIGLLGVVLWSNKQQAAKNAEPPKDATPKILSLTEPSIQQVEIDHRGGEMTVVKRAAGDQWQISGPKEVPTDQGSVNAMITSLATISSERVVDPNVTDLATYGLSPAVLTIKIDMKGGKNTTLLVGEDSPSGSVYAKVEGDPRLFTMAKTVETNLDKSTKDLRDKRLLTFDANKLTKLDLDLAKQTPLEFTRSGPSQWQIVKPRSMRTDSTQMEDFTSRLHEATMDTNVTPEDEKKYEAAFASATPVATVTVTDPSGTQKLEVRKVKDDTYGKSSVVDGVYKITAADLTSFFDKKVDDFRNKKLFDFGFDDPTHIQIKDGAKTLAVDKSGLDWHSGDGKTMDSLSVDSLTDKLRDLAATKLLDSGSFGTPEIEITVISNKGKRTEKVQIAASGKDFLAKREGDPTLYQLDASAVQGIRNAMADVKPQAPQTSAKK